jgi:hypothetical protein
VVRKNILSLEYQKEISGGQKPDNVGRYNVTQADEAAAVMTQLPPERAAALVLALASGDALPGFHAQAVDAWGNATGPTDSLPCKVSVECEALSPAQSSFQLPASGRAYVEGTSHRSFIPCQATPQ